MYQQAKLHLQQIQAAMEKLELWQAQPPAAEAFDSKEPFALDTMSPEQWLQWIFVPRMLALIENGAALPNQIAVSPYLEEALSELDGLPILLAPMQELEQLLTSQC